VDASTDVPNLLIALGVMAGLVLVFRRYLPDFRRQYGQERGATMLLLYMLWFPGFLWVVLRDRNRAKAETATSAGDDAPKKSGWSGWGTV
jgi:uncharacterized membrane protein YqjE